MSGGLARALWVVALLVGVSVGADAAEYLQTLKEGTWICVSPAAYDQAIQQEKAWQGRDPAELQKDLLDRRQCMYLDAERVGSMMVPFATIVERQEAKVKVQFTLESRKRIEFLHRQINRVTYAGWTDSVNLVPKEIP